MAARKTSVPEKSPHLRPAPVEAALAGGRVLDRHQDRAAPLAADAYALGEAERDEQQRGEHPDLREGRQETYEGRGDPHDEEREDQHGLAPDPVPVVPEDDAPHRPRH